MAAVARTGAVRVRVPLSPLVAKGATRTPMPLDLDYTLHLPAEGSHGGRSGLALIYLHGGGLLFGERDDLPRPSIDAILACGHALVCLDYPLAPAIAAPDIIDAVLQAVRALAADVLPTCCCTQYALFGRSAGAYLALNVAARLKRGGARGETEAHPQAAPCPPGASAAHDDGAALQPSGAYGAGAPDEQRASSSIPPVAILDFYGYPGLADRFIWEPAPRYLDLPAIDAATALSPTAHDAAQPPTTARVTERYALYVYARQTGRWGELLGIAPDDAATASLAPGDIAALPPLFIAASTGDEDVPFRVSRVLARQAPCARLHTVQGLGHTFDQDLRNPAGMRAYQAALTFLDGVLGRS